VVGVIVVIVVCIVAGSVAQILRTNLGRRATVSPGYRATPFRLVLAGGRGVLVVVVVAGILLASWESFWLSTHGGGTAIALTGSFVVLGILFVSALARLALSAGLALFAAFEREARRSVLGSRFTSVWDSGEAIGVLAVAILAVSAIGLGVWFQRAREELRHALPPEDPVRALATATPRELLTGLAPVLMFTGRDSWRPQRVDAFLRKSTVFDLQGRRQMRHPRVEDLVDRCPGAARPCLLVDAACDRRTCVTGANQSSRPVAYGRVVFKNEDRRMSWRISPFRGDLDGIVQWWIFAPYDRWTAPLFLGLGSAVQEHAADWEAVTIGFSRDRPLFVALSSHCGGTWRRYDDVAVSDRILEHADALGQRLHTLVAYADGSHALYFDPGWARAPDAIGCALERASGWFRAVSYTANAVDTTRDNVRALLVPIVGREAARVLSFPAYWSYSSTYTFETPMRTFATTAGTMTGPAGRRSGEEGSLCRSDSNHLLSPDVALRSTAGRLIEPTASERDVLTTRRPSRAARYVSCAAAAGSGILASIRVPRPGSLVTSREPPSASMRSTSPRIPDPASELAPPTPSSSTLTSAHSLRRATRTVTLVASAYRATFVSASATT
jgi:hypothetical protein